MTGEALRVLRRRVITGRLASQTRKRNEMTSRNWRGQCDGEAGLGEIRKELGGS